MNELLASIVEAHGGFDRWRRFNRVAAAIVTGGALWGMKNLTHDQNPRRMSVSLHEQVCSLAPFGDPDWHTEFTPERVAILRARGDANRVQTELAKQMIRSVDDQPADWSGLATPGSVEQFWREIGAKYRTMIVHLYNQLHVMTRQESDDFLDNCVAVVTAC